MILFYEMNEEEFLKSIGDKNVASFIFALVATEPSEINLKPLYLILA